MKKSLLLSSIMALVLVIALSTATFAWYGSSTQASATMATLEASSGNGNLQISLDQSTWDSDVTYNTTTGAKYVPASLNATVTDITADALSTKTNWVVGNENANGKNNLRAATAADTTVVEYSLYLKNAGSEIINVNITEHAFTVADAETASSNLVNDCAWIMVVTRKYNTTDGGVTKVYSKDGTETETIVLNSAYSKTTLNATPSANEDLTETAKTDVTATADANLKFANMAPDEVITIKVYNWIDGWKASSHASDNSQQGKVTFDLQFDIANT